MGRARENGEENFQHRQRPTIDRTMEPASASREGGISSLAGGGMCVSERSVSAGTGPGMAWHGMAWHGRARQARRVERSRKSKANFQWIRHTGERVGRRNTTLHLLLTSC